MKDMYNMAIDILTKAKAEGKTAFVGGGWVRDKLLGKDPKDLDIFVLNPYEEDMELILNDYGDPVYYGGSGENIREDVSHIEKYNDVDVDIIYMKRHNIVQVCNSFDTSICQCYAILNNEGDLSYYTSTDFNDYLSKNIIWLYSDIQTTEGHISRIKQKFPNAEYKDKSTLRMFFSNTYSIYKE